MDSMKVKMRRLLSKHKDGILCNDFMDVYGVSIQLNNKYIMSNIVFIFIIFTTYLGTYLNNLT